MNRPSQSHDVSGLNRARSAAIKSAERLSKKIINEHPEVADDYRSGLSHREIALKHELHNEAGITIGVAREAVRLALQTLMPDKERESCRQKIMLVIGKKVGRRLFLEKKGFHGLSPKERLRISSKSGKINYRRKTGLFGMSPKEKRLANIKSIHAQGKTPWIVDLVDPKTGLNEVDYLLDLAKKTGYIIQSGPQKGSFNNIKIAETINTTFHQGRNVRTPRSVNSFLRRLRKEGRIS